MRPEPYTTAHVPTLWLDFSTGAGVDDGGRRVQPVIGGRRTKPQLVDLLNTGHKHGARRLMLSGRIPPGTPGREHWLTVSTPGWRTNGHWLKSPPTGRFVNTTDGAQLEVRLVAEWFPGDDVTATVAREAWDVTTALLRPYNRGSYLLNSPAGTGQNLWAYTLPGDPGFDYDATLVSDDIAELIHATSGQHRTETFVDGDPGRCDCGDCLPLITADKIDGLAVSDGRFMYAGLARGEVASGPARRLTGEQATELWNLTEQNAKGSTVMPGRRVKARYCIRFTVPAGWETLGLFGVQLPDSGSRWHWPNRPGSTHETWVDGAELDHAFAWAGWDYGLEILEGIEFTKARTLDTFIDRMLRAWKKTDELAATEQLRGVVRQGVRSITLQTIGGFHSLGRGRTFVVDSLDQVPQEFIATVVPYGDRFVYTAEQALNPRQRAFHRPELSAHIWAKERARMILGRTPKFKVNGVAFDQWGAIEVDPSQLVAINGDALHTTTVHPATLPSDLGGADNGDVGRIRLKGWLPGPHAAPRSRSARESLAKKAEAAGVDPALARAADSRGPNRQAR